jgi:flagellar biosynthesis/type III secretory pathway protein FliH
LQTPEEFRSLSDLLREGHAVVAESAETIEPAAEDEDGFHDEIAAARDVRLFRARLEEALESTIVTLRCDIAAEIVGRELQLAPASIAQIVRRAVRRCAAEHPVRVRVHPEDMAALSGGGIETVGDHGLRRGDAVLECDGGAIDISLGVRLDAVLRSLR